MLKNYAFIDGQNLYSGINELGWKVDMNRLRRYLGEKYNVEKAFYFIGYIPTEQKLYNFLQSSGFILVFKPVIFDGNRKPKGNVDADLVLNVMIEFEHFEKAVLVTSDGDFYSLVDHLYDNKKLEIILSPYKKTCSSLLKKSGKEKIEFLERLKSKLKLKKGKD